MHGESKLLCIHISGSNKEKHGKNWLDVGNDDSQQTFKSIEKVGAFNLHFLIICRLTICLQIAPSVLKRKYERRRCIHESPQYTTHNLNFMFIGLLIGQRATFIQLKMARRKS
jgi:hypothetical protein